MAHEPASAAERKRVTAPKKAPYWTECLERSYRYVQAHNDLAGLWLAHGEVAGLPPGHQLHAWVLMPNGSVFCGVFQRFFQAELRYAAWRTHPLALYDPDAALMLRTYIGKKLYGESKGYNGDWRAFLQLSRPGPNESAVAIDANRERALLVNTGCITPPPASPKNRQRKLSADG